LLATLAQVADSKKDWKAKLDYNRRWALSAPDSPEALNGHAWELLTSPDEKLRDVKTALALASKAAEASKPESPAILDTLALAYARNGKFREAVDTQQRAIALLPPNMTPAQRKEYEDHLREFRDGLERQPR
jgi:tetratricopeptide (TPR) repeat protein